MSDRGAELLALLFVAREGPRQATLAFRGEPKVGDAAVGRGLLALDQAGFLRAADELGDGALGEL